MAAGISTEYVKCDLCGSEHQTLLFSKTDPITRQDFNLVQCSCGMAFVNPMPAEESIPALYPDDYHKDKDVDVERFRRLLDYLPRQSGSLLDIGCGRGDFVKLAGDAGWKAEGVDLIDWKSPHEISLRIGDFLTMELPESHYQAVTAWAFLEHVRRPSLYFRRVSQLLSPQGRFVFLVPNIGAPGMRSSCAEDVPRHLSLFTPESISGYLNACSMEIDRIFHTDQIYTSYPFGLLRRWIIPSARRNSSCAYRQNKSVAMLRNQRFRGNIRPWMKEVAKSVPVADIVIDLADMGLAVLIAKASKLIGNYGIVIVSAKKKQS